MTNTFDLVNGFMVNGWNREDAINVIETRADVTNEFYVLVYDMEKEAGNYDNLEFTDAKTAYAKFDSMKSTIEHGQRLEIIWSPDPEDGTVNHMENVVICYYLG